MSSFDEGMSKKNNYWGVLENLLVLYGWPSVAAAPYITVIATRRGGHGGPPVQD